MGSRTLVCLLVIYIQILVIAAETYHPDFVALMSLKDVWKNTPPSWIGLDPCSDNWEGIGCSNSRVTSMEVLGMCSSFNCLWKDLSCNTGLTGSLPSSIGNLKKLSNLILVGCGFTGLIPDTIGSLQQLVFLEGFQLWLFDNNNFTGNIPFTLGLVQTLEVLGPAPSNLNNLTSVKELLLCNNKLTGPIPNLTGMNSLRYVDMSNNTFNMSNIPPWFSSFPSLTTLKMENTNLQGQIPVALFSLSELQTLILSNNRLNGTLDIGSSISNQPKLIELRRNLISEIKQSAPKNIELIFNSVIFYCFLKTCS
ncbi:hypothetical protein F0562_020146 [Nyssa sinensis]|uniref:Leucine-rich repeat-containing N-terminal plant-type domain-containing protein n=1 Tax=Nyssa sinensis TaxID=561372 RepID=A0A5J5BUV6_9ASTE|nr:hypothetical protein F0562_020146 [Nyssa sinensis]